MAWDDHRTSEQRQWERDRRRWWKAYGDQGGGAGQLALGLQYGPDLTAALTCALCDGSHPYWQCPCGTPRPGPGQ